MTIVFCEFKARLPNDSLCVLAKKVHWNTRSPWPSNRSFIKLKWKWTLAGLSQKITFPFAFEFLVVGKMASSAMAPVEKKRRMPPTNSEVTPESSLYCNYWFGEKIVVALWCTPQMSLRWGSTASVVHSVDRRQLPGAGAPGTVSPAENWLSQVTSVRSHA